MQTSARDVLVGRQAETRRLDELLGAARAGRGDALVLRGEAGIGKSALLAHARRAATGFRVIDASGSEFEMDLPFATLHRLCVPVLAHLDDLPGRRREALEIAFGLATGTPDPFRVGLAALELLAAAARERPLLCLPTRCEAGSPSSGGATATARCSCCGPPSGCPRWTPKGHASVSSTRWR
ncbi:hypothetical protein GCM10023196_106870 [Actinoallomurus vinaceus]|uniref:Orc1-like AAA ATPase domain-containing protein n=1 Tax=Actinoallomurus vinaceus TaxID=1080074 RepID=A0ABP8UWQ9_9ACTN